jgi:hypothetical protein
MHANIFSSPKLRRFPNRELHSISDTRRMGEILLVARLQETSITAQAPSRLGCLENTSLQVIPLRFLNLSNAALWIRVLLSGVISAQGSARVRTVTTQLQRRKWRLLFFVFTAEIRVRPEG